MKHREEEVALGVLKFIIVRQSICLQVERPL